MSQQVGPSCDRKTLLKSGKRGRAVLDELIKTEDFQNRIAALRGRYGIDPFQYSERPSSSFAIPSEWAEARGQSTPISVSAALRDVQELVREYSLEGVEYYRAVWLYLFFNRVVYDQFHSGPPMCKIVDVPTEHLSFALHLEQEARLKHLEAQASKSPRAKERTALEREFLAEQLRARSKYHDAEVRAFPLAVLISPHASINDIVVFVREHKEQIKTFQEVRRKVRPEFGKKRTKRKADRDDLIYQERAKGRSLREIQKVVEANYPGEDIKPGHISTVIRRETKRRVQQ